MDASAKFTQNVKSIQLSCPPGSNGVLSAPDKNGLVQAKCVGNDALIYNGTTPTARECIFFENGVRLGAHHGTHFEQMKNAMPGCF